MRKKIKNIMHKLLKGKRHSLWYSLQHFTQFIAWLIHFLLPYFIIKQMLKNSKLCKNTGCSFMIWKHHKLFVERTIDYCRYFNTTKCVSSRVFFKNSFDLFLYKTFLSVYFRWKQTSLSLYSWLNANINSIFSK